VRESFLITVLVASSLFAGTSAPERRIDNNAIISELDAKMRADNNKKEGAVAEKIIRQRVEDYAKAVRAKEIDTVTAFYTPNIVSFGSHCLDRIDSCRSARRKETGKQRGGGQGYTRSEKGDWIAWTNLVQDLCKNTTSG
jgi:hypothetical protein